MNDLSTDLAALTLDRDARRGSSPSYGRWIALVVLLLVVAGG